MNTNFKVFEDMYNTLERQQTNLSRNDNRAKFKVAEVKSIQTSTATVRFVGDSFDVSGIPIKTGVTLSVTDIVRVQVLNNGFQLTSFVIDSIIS